MSAAARRLPRMCRNSKSAPSVAEADEAIRCYVAGRRSWTPAELAELARLRVVWQRAVRESVVTAA